MRLWAARVTVNRKFWEKLKKGIRGVYGMGAWRAKTHRARPVDDEAKASFGRNKE